MIKAYKKYWKGFFDFRSRTSRKDFWLAVIMTMIVSFLLGLVFYAAIGGGGISIDPKTFEISFKMGADFYASGAWGLINFIPSIAMIVRRLHDIGKSGWFILLDLIPVVGPIILLVFMFMPSKH